MVFDETRNNLVLSNAHLKLGGRRRLSRPDASGAARLPSAHLDLHRHVAKGLGRNVHSEQQLQLFFAIRILAVDRFVAEVLQ